MSDTKPTLTLDQLAVARSYLRESQKDGDTHDLEMWLVQHADALLVAAERVAALDATGLAHLTPALHHGTLGEGKTWLANRPPDASTWDESVRAWVGSREPNAAGVVSYKLPPGISGEEAHSFLQEQLGDRAARVRLAELAPEAAAAFSQRDPLTLGEMESWYRARGLVVSLKIRGDQITYDFVGLIEPG